MRVLILGIDGYIGYALSQHLLSRGDRIYGIDDLSRRERVDSVGSSSLTPIKPFFDRFNQQEVYLSSLETDYKYIRDVLSNFAPDAIVHLAEQPSAPYSMRGVNSSVRTQYLNVIGTLNLLWAMHEVKSDAHLIKIGTMGEYGTPNCDIPEGKVPEDCIGEGCIEESDVKAQCPMSGLLFPRQANSFYHLSKVHDTHNIEFACRNWGLASTDIMQGVVFGLNDDENDPTRFDYDQYFGTAINRFCAQVISAYPLTVYGSGEQRRGFLTLKDSIQCLTLAIDNPPEAGEYRTWNQYESVYSIQELAMAVSDAAYEDHRISSGITHLPNPRNEADEHYYNPTCETLHKLGYIPDTNLRKNISTLIGRLLPYKDNVNKHVIAPTTTWR